MGFKIQFLIFALSVVVFEQSNAACCGSTVGLQQVRFGYPRYEGYACSPYPASFAPGCDCGAPAPKCLRSGPAQLTSCNSCGCNAGTYSCNSDSSVCACFKKANCGGDCSCGSCGPGVYFPEVEYPVTVIDALGPFYYGTCSC